MTLLLLIGVTAGTYYLMSFLQAVLHREYGHRRRIAAVFEGHAVGHHGKYPAHHLQDDTYEDLEGHALNYYGIPAAVFAVAIYSAFGPLVTVAHLLGIFITFRVNIILHRHYHLAETPLERFAWFREKRRLHFIHHQDARVNFAVVEFWIDRLLGTFRAGERAPQISGA